MGAGGETDPMTGLGRGRMSYLQDARLARELAAAAGAELLKIRGTATGTELGDAGDRASQRLLAAALAERRPGDRVLSEEAKDSPDRLSASRVWIVDPLDGTREYSGPPRDDWAVHVALWADGDLVAGAVAIPARGVVDATDAPPSPPERAPGPLRLAVSRSRPPAFVTALAAELGAVLVPMGSAGVKCASVWRGEVDAYLHAGGQYEWDSAAPVAVARSAGLCACRLDGTPLVYNRPDPSLPDLIVSRPEFEASLLDAARRHAPEVLP
ncbi:MAG: 3(2), 5-bisphosphate nucleotidase [Actinomycetota bacterium]|nr:3(2), 5-bisphosphate nucleotidase [Actinomycetota bacterium]